MIVRHLTGETMKDEYLQTRFVTELADQSLPEKFYIVTAHNPFGGRATDTENEENNARLLQQIRNSGWNHFPVTGQCEDHAEAGFGVACSRVEAVMLGETFRQDAIYEVEDNEVRLVDCKGVEGDDLVGSWSALQAPAR